MKSLDELSHFLKQYDTHNRNESTNKKYPPIEQWKPTEYLEMDILIKSNGEWWHEGSKITRSKLVNLFSSILVVEVSKDLGNNDDSSDTHNKVDETHKASYYLKTPVQKVKIKVEDAPLFINDVSIVEIPSNTETEYWLEFHTTTDDIIRLDKHHIPYFQVFKNEIRPYISVRNGLHALISRSVYYHLMEIGELIETDEQTSIRLYSGGQAFDMLYPDSNEPMS